MFKKFMLLSVVMFSVLNFHLAIADAGTSSGGGSQTFEQALKDVRSLNEGVTLAETEQMLVDQGYVRSEVPFAVVWADEGYTATVWYMDSEGANSVEVLVRGYLKSGIVVDSITLQHHHP